MSGTATTCPKLLKNHMGLYQVHECPNELHIGGNILLDTSGNHTPGGRSYYDLVDTWADSVCIHHLVLKACSKVACVMQAAACGLLQLILSI